MKNKGFGALVSPEGTTILYCYDQLMINLHDLVNIEQAAIINAYNKKYKLFNRFNSTSIEGEVIPYVISLN